MEQLPQPTAARLEGDAGQNSLGLDYLSNLHDGFEQTSFEEYPGARGMPMNKLCSGSFEAAEANFALAIVQNWLFFGMLESVLHTRIHTNRFIEYDSNAEKTLLRTRSLPQHIELWREKVAALETSAKEDWRSSLRPIFRTASGFLTYLAASGARNFLINFEDYMTPLIVLLETLQWAWSDVFGDIEESEPLPANMSKAQVNRLLDHGWCPSTVTDIASTFNSPCVFSFASSLRDHQAAPKGDHLACTVNNCALRVIDPSTYKPSHVDASCKCESLIPDLWLLYATIKMDRIILIEVSESGELLTTPYSQDGDTPFVAISHVWSEGRGSWSEQGLPKCQILALFDAAAKAYQQTFETDKPRVALWIDSMCIPKNPEIRAQAIGLISETFWASDMVLVVDNGLLKMELTDSLPEQLMLIFMSGWMQRLWTLVEGLRAKTRLTFWVKDGFLDARVFASDEVMSLRGKDVVCTELLGWFAELMILSLTPGNLTNLLVHMSRRRTSWAEDEIVAIADFFGLDTASYVPLDREERMQQFLIEHKQGVVESNLIFFRSFKMRTPNFTWAPLSFLRIKEAPYPTLFRLKGEQFEPMGIITEGGLVSKYHYIRFEEPWTVQAASISVTDGDSVLLRDKTANETYTAIPVRLWDEKPEEQPAELVADMILLSGQVRPMEDFLGVAVKQVDVIDGEDGPDALVVTRLLDVHVINDPFKEIGKGAQALQVANSECVFVIR